MTRLERPLPAAMRRDRILEYIRSEAACTVGELAALVDVSPVTIHRDLGQLHADGLIVRVHGGAKPVDTGAADMVTDWSIRLARKVEAKRAIAARARECIGDDASVFLDASSTCLAVAREIERRPPRSLRIVTNSPSIAATIHAPTVGVVIVPGALDQGVRAILGPWAAEFVGELSLDLALVSGAGLTVDRGLTTTQRDIADLLRAALRSSSAAIALVDSSKWGREGLLTCAHATEFEAIVVDHRLDAEQRAAFRDAGATLLVARG